MNKVRGLFLAVAAVVVSGVTLVAPAAAQAACPDVQVVFARGTGEPVGVGRVGDAFVDALRPLVPGKSVAVDAVN
jgi:cutinase